MATQYKSLIDVEQAGNLNPVERQQLEQLRSNKKFYTDEGFFDSAGYNTYQTAEKARVEAERAAKEAAAKAEADRQQALAVEAQKRQATERQAMLDAQTAKETDFLGRFSTAVSSAPKFSELATQYGSELGLPQMREASIGMNQSLIDLQSALESLPSRVAGETRGFDVNANQLARIQDARSQPLVQNMNKTATEASRAQERLGSTEQQLATLLGYADKDFQRTLLPYEQEAAFLGEQIARQVTGFNKSAEDELNLILNKLSFNQTLSADEIKRVNELADKEDSFLKQKELVGQEQDVNRTNMTEQNKYTLDNLMKEMALKEQQAIAAEQRGVSAEKDMYTFKGLEDLRLAAMKPKAPTGIASGSLNYVPGYTPIGGQSNATGGTSVKGWRLAG